MTGQIPKRITIDAPDATTILAARHLDATEGRVQVGATVDTATRGAITTVLRYIAKAHNSPAGDPQLDAAYRERAHLVALLAALYPAHIGYTDPAAIDWLVVTIETPTGQMSWHIAERDRDLFEHVRLVPAVHNVWDGHSTEEKYARLRRLTTALVTPSPVDQHPDVLRERAETDMHAVAEAEARRQLDADPHGLKTGLVIHPYIDHGLQRWLFRCWGTGTCDGWLGLGHHSQQSAEREWDRHVAEEHTTTRQP